MKKFSAGILVYRKNNGNVEIFLIHPGGPFFAKKDSWGIPKGEYEEDEDPLGAARREFAEETGQPAPSGKTIELGAIKRSDGKFIRVWAVEGDVLENIQSNSFKLEWPPKSGRIQEFPEVDKGQWFNIEDALGKMAHKLHKGQTVFVERLAEKLNIEKPESQKPNQSTLF